MWWLVCFIGIEIFAHCNKNCAFYFVFVITVLIKKFRDIKEIGAMKEMTNKKRLREIHRRTFADVDVSNKGHRRIMSCRYREISWKDTNFKMFVQALRRRTDFSNKVVKGNDKYILLDRAGAQRHKRFSGIWIL